MQVRLHNRFASGHFNRNYIWYFGQQFLRKLRKFSSSRLMCELYHTCDTNNQKQPNKNKLLIHPCTAISKKRATSLKCQCEIHFNILVILKPTSPVRVNNLLAWHMTAHECEIPMGLLNSSWIGFSNLKFYIVLHSSWQRIYYSRNVTLLCKISFSLF